MKAKVRIRGRRYRHVVNVRTTTESEDKNEQVKEAIRLAVMIRLNTKDCDILTFKPFVFEALSEEPQFWEGLLRSNKITYNWHVEEYI